jgi:hypothetical protein
MTGRSAVADLRGRRVGTEATASTQQITEISRSAIRASTWSWAACREFLGRAQILGLPVA